MATVALDALPPPVATRVLQLLPVADRVRAGGVSPAWRALAHAPALYGPELVLADVLDAPRTVSDAAEALSRDYMSRHAKYELRCSSLFILRSLSALAAGTLTRLDVRGIVSRSGDETPDKLLAEALVEVAARNLHLTEILADAPTKLPACLQLLARCPCVAALTVSRLAVAPAELLALTGQEAALAARLTLPSLDLGRDTQNIDAGDYVPRIAFFGAITTGRVNGALAAELQRTLAAVGAGAWHVLELHLPGCKSDDSVLVTLLQALTASVAAHPSACVLERLVLHYSWSESRKPMSAAAGNALAAAAAALPALRSITFSDERDPTQAGRQDYEDYIDAGSVRDDLLEKYDYKSNTSDVTPGGAALALGLSKLQQEQHEVKIEFAGGSHYY